jgi:hypothetical protein
MSTEISTNVIYGIFIDLELIRKMMTNFPAKTAKTAKEERFCPKTGKSLGFFKVVNEPERIALVIGDKKYEYEEDISKGLDIMVKKIHPDLCCYPCCDKHGDIYAFVIGISVNDASAKSVFEKMKFVDMRVEKILQKFNSIKPKSKPISIKPAMTAILEVY